MNKLVRTKYNVNGRYVYVGLSGDTVIYFIANKHHRWQARVMLTPNSGMFERTWLSNKVEYPNLKACLERLQPANAAYIRGL